MSDIVARLRAHGSKTEMEAADEIERLRQIYFDRVKEQADEIERLRAGVLWHCEACGTLTHDDNCDCTRTGTGTQRLIRFDPKPMSDEIERLRAKIKKLNAALCSPRRGLVF
jgi:hypothetical protein